ncbi:MAG: SUMF1/EgtB/PvdO family nonheme iron enzyme [Treponema sp.]|nr:SUMF1/EgtB/PvdO family nonheme iron enzyme [Treponema sp.]
MLPHKGAASGSNRVKRGGSWNNTAANTRASYRNRNTPENRNNNIGFRLARSVLAYPCGQRAKKWNTSC